MISNEILQSSPSHELEGNINNLNKPDNNNENTNVDHVSARNEKVLVEKTENSGNDIQRPIQLRRSVSEVTTTFSLLYCRFYYNYCLFNTCSVNIWLELKVRNILEGFLLSFKK